MRFIHCFAGFPGSVHDSRVFKYSGLRDMCTEDYFPHDSHILADSAYKLQQHVLVPYKDNGHLSVEQRNFNKMLSKNRSMVECSIGLLKMRFRRLLDMCDVKCTELVPYFIVTCCIMHNICLKEDNEFEYPIMFDQEGLPLLGPLSPSNLSRRLGEIKRNTLTNYFDTL